MYSKRFISLFSVVVSFVFLTNGFAIHAQGETAPPQTFHYKYNYEELYHFLDVSVDEFKLEWNSGKTISEIAEEREIYPYQLTIYLAEKQFIALNKALEKGEIDSDFYYDYAISQMEPNITEFINRNPNKNP
jgi:hypothetical protein